MSRQAPAALHELLDAIYAQVDPTEIVAGLAVSSIEVDTEQIISRAVVRDHATMRFGEVETLLSAGPSANRLLSEVMGVATIDATVRDPT